MSYFLNGDEASAQPQPEAPWWKTALVDPITEIVKVKVGPGPGTVNVTPDPMAKVMPLLVLGGVGVAAVMLLRGKKKRS